MFNFLKLMLLIFKRVYWETIKTFFRLIVYLKIKLTNLLKVISMFNVYVLFI